MTTPVTTLDQRFSDPDAAATGWDQTRQALEQAELFWVTTVRADGRPHMTPLVAVWSDGALHFCTGTGEQKAVNLRGNRHVILSTGCNAWDQGLDVVVEGDAVQVTDDETLRPPGRGVDGEVGRALAVPGARRVLLPPGSTEPVSVLGAAGQGARVCQG